MAAARVNKSSVRLEIWKNNRFFSSYIHCVRIICLGAPWVSQAANKRIAQSVKTAIEVDKIEKLLATVL